MATPKGVKQNRYDYGVVVGTKGKTLQIYEDFQCPACAGAEAALAEPLAQKVNQNQLTLVFQPMTFLDQRLGGDSSARATNAFGCAIDQNRTIEYHQQLFSNQPQVEGTGYTDQDLKNIAVKANIPDTEKFNKCVDEKPYLEWAQTSSDKAKEAGVEGTPTFKIDGQTVNLQTIGSLEEFMELLQTPNNN